MAARPYGTGIYNSWELSVFTNAQGSTLRLLMVEDSGQERIEDDPLDQSDQWRHFCLVWDGVRANVYIDTVLNNSLAIESIGNDTGQIRLGADLDSGTNGNFFPGAIDEFRMYGRALDQDEVGKLATL